MEKVIVEANFDQTHVHITYSDESKVSYPFFKYGCQTIDVPGPIPAIIGKPAIVFSGTCTVGRKRGCLTLRFKDRTQYNLFFHVA